MVFAPSLLLTKYELSLLLDVEFDSGAASRSKVHLKVLQQVLAVKYNGRGVALRARRGREHRRGHQSRGRASPWTSSLLAYLRSSDTEMTLSSMYERSLPWHATKWYW